MRAKEWKGGIIFASAHSGSIYPDAFIERSDLAIKQLRRNEDAFITNLFSPAPDLGAPLIVANFPRCFVDVNRASDELPSFWRTDGKIISPRAEIGMGVVPTMLSETINIYSEPLSLSAAKVRIKDLYHPYHDALQGLIDEARILVRKSFVNRLPLYARFQLDGFSTV